MQIGKWVAAAVVVVVGISHRLCKQNKSVLCPLMVFFGRRAQHFQRSPVVFSEMTLRGSFTPQGIWSESAHTTSAMAVGRDADLKFLSPRRWRVMLLL